MPPDVAERAFDPFVATKPTGVGTGLGRLMIYGLVKQSRGHVRICSEVGKGTTIKLYLVRAPTDVIAANAVAAARHGLQADGYAGYAGPYERGVTEAACLAHARRKFFDVHAATQSLLALECNASPRCMRSRP
jgi:hypothetical protein